MDETPYPVQKAFDEGQLKVSDLHQIYYWQYGNPVGKPVIYCHGGPGSGCSDKDTVFFNPQVFRVILFDQRGCGKSTPLGETRENTTWDLVADMEKIREKFGIEKWMVFGGSWGSTLSLVYAETHPDRTASLIIRGIYLADDYETRWFYQTGTKSFYPEEWDKLCSPIEPHLRHDLIYAYNQLLHGPDKEVAYRAAQDWTRYEYSCYKLIQDEDYVEHVPYGVDTWASVVVEHHYFLNNAFMEDGFIVSEPQISKIRHLPCHIVQGRYDMCTPPAVAHLLRNAYGENCKLTWSPEGGHSCQEPGTRAALAKAADEFAKYQ